MEHIKLGLLCAIFNMIKYFLQVFAVNFRRFIFKKHQPI